MDIMRLYILAISAVFGLIAADILILKTKVRRPFV